MKRWFVLVVWSCIYFSLGVCFILGNVLLVISIVMFFYFLLGIFCLSDLLLGVIFFIVNMLRLGKRFLRFVIFFFKSVVLRSILGGFVIFRSMVSLCFFKVLFVMVFEDVMLRKIEVELLVKC